MKELAESIKVTEFAFDTAHTVIDALSSIEAIAPFMAIAGFALFFIEFFIPSQAEILLKALKVISDQLVTL